MKTVDEFWNKVDRSSDENCWCWLAGKFQGTGYGLCSWRGRLMGAHRVAWQISNGDIADGLWVLHKCDNKLCVNPSHLFLGTPRNNTDDMVSKGRQAKGDEVGRAKLTEEDVLEIRRLYAQGGVTKANLARQYNLDVSMGHLIIRRKLWKHI